MVKTQLAAIRRLCADLGLPEGGPYTQDWAYELPEEFRSEAHFYRYVDAYQNAAYGDLERQVLVELTLDVVNDLMQRDGGTGEAAWSTLATVIRRHPGLHRDQVEYWASFDADLEDAFTLTPLVRELWNELYGA
ncbi:hypothetical protein [Chondromyces crocatus]|uniref:CdiI immunity protein domain-containing protein n=1 Tax=Chondromyces crocatus TaxID=52 RepID=A0A0K1ERZ7_CHOCO|nr:hypothetical protein [Chondromyces crocatus]AKT43559.1 uncharacterized protein CMC5_077910 [Chondromyces crocatus]